MSDVPARVNARTWDAIQTLCGGASSRKLVKVNPLLRRRRERGVEQEEPENNSPLPLECGEGESDYFGAEWRNSYQAKHSLVDEDEDEDEDEEAGYSDDDAVADFLEARSEAVETEKKGMWYSGSESLPSSPPSPSPSPSPSPPQLLPHSRSPTPSSSSSPAAAAAAVDLNQRLDHLDTTAFEVIPESSAVASSPNGKPEKGWAV